jgi:hypothetical protein
MLIFFFLRALGDAIVTELAVTNAADVAILIVI